MPRSPSMPIRPVLYRKDAGYIAQSIGVSKAVAATPHFFSRPIEYANPRYM